MSMFLELGSAWLDVFEQDRETQRNGNGKGKMERASSVDVEQVLRSAEIRYGRGGGCLASSKGRNAGGLTDGFGAGTLGLLNLGARVKRHWGGGWSIHHIDLI